MSGLAHLATLDLEFRQQRHPSIPAHAVPPSKFSDKTANDLTRCIVRWFHINGHFSTRLSSTGTYRADVGKFVASQQRKGLPDVYAVIGGRAIHVEVKVGKDRLSDDQKQAVADLQTSGALVFIATDFQSFYEWYCQHWQPQRPHPIKRLATPDLFAPLQSGQNGKGGI